MTITTNWTMCPHAAAYDAARVAVSAVRPSMVADVTFRALELKGTGLSAARMRFSAAPMATAQLPISDVVVTDVNAGIRAWSPPV